MEYEFSPQGGFPICQTSALFRVLKYRELYYKYLGARKAHSFDNLQDEFLPQPRWGSSCSPICLFTLNQ